MEQLPKKIIDFENINPYKIINRLATELTVTLDEFLYNIIKNIEKVNIPLIDNKNEFIDNDKNFSGIIYDIYYQLSLMKLENKLQGFTLSPFYYPCHFDILIDNSNYTLRVTSIHREFRMIYTSILLNNQQIKTYQELNHNFEYKNHTSINSILNELYQLKEYIYQKI